MDRGGHEYRLGHGNNAIGGHWDALPVEILAIPKGADGCGVSMTRSENWPWWEGKASKESMWNRMYIPSEVPWTLELSDQYLIAVNKDNQGCPVYYNC